MTWRNGAGPWDWPEPDDDDLDAHLADEGLMDDDGELMDPLCATLTEQEQRERFGGYGRGGEE